MDKLLIRGGGRLGPGTLWPGIEGLETLIPMQCNAGRSNEKSRNTIGLKQSDTIKLVQINRRIFTKIFPFP